MSQKGEDQDEHPPSDSTDLAHYLEQLSHDGLRVLNDKDFEHKTPLGRKVASHVSQDYICYVDSISDGLSFDEANKMWADRSQLDPRMAFRMTELWGEVELSKGRATVYQQFELVGWMDSGDSKLKGIAQQSWRLDGDGVWRLWKMVGFRTGEVDDRSV